MDTLSFATIADLKAASGLTDGQTAVVGDVRRGGDFIWAATSTISDDDGTVFQLTAGGSGRWKRVISGRWSVSWFGTAADGATDDRAKILGALASLSAAGGGSLFFPKGTYVISSHVMIPYNNIHLYGDLAATILNTQTAAGGYPRDCFRFGNSLPVDGGTNNPTNPTYSFNVSCVGFIFSGCRVGVIFSYCQLASARDIIGNGCEAAAAFGNDNDSQCYDVLAENIKVVAWNTGYSIFYVIGLYSTTRFVVRGVYCAASPPSAVAAACLQIENCSKGSASDLHFYTPLMNGINVTSSPDVLISDFTVQGAVVGVVAYSNGSTSNNSGTISDGQCIGCSIGIQVYTRNTTFSHIKTSGCTTSLSLQTDSAANTFDGCVFSENSGAGIIYEEGGTGITGIDLQRWIGNKGGIEGKADGYYGGRQAAFRVTDSVGATHVTGDSTLYTLAFNNVEVNNAGVFSTASSTFTAPIDGLYLFHAGVAFSGSAGPTALLIGGVRVGMLPPPGGPASLAGSALLKLTRGATVTAQFLATGGAKTVDVAGAPTVTYFDGILVA